MLKKKDNHIQRNKMYFVATKITQGLIFHESTNFWELWASFIIKSCHAIEISKLLHSQQNIGIC